MTEKEILKRDISELETMLGITNSKLNNLYEQEISSVKNVLEATRNYLEEELQNKLKILNFYLKSLGLTEQKIK